ncbi:hypothetical protein Goarm_011218, partial [Gossypium armourianum]|nr:hypothetical protein [Gossypium armourianum]
MRSTGRSLGCIGRTQSSIGR